MPVGTLIPMTYGASRPDTSAACGNDDGNNGFYALYNWAILGDGEHTAVKPPTIAFGGVCPVKQLGR